MAKSAYRAIALFLIGIGVAIGVLAAPAPAAAATCTWTGAGGDARWSTSSNWTGCPTPGNGDTLDFPAGAAPLSVNDIAGLSIGLIRVTGVAAISSYVITGLGVTVGTVFSTAGVDLDGNGPTLALPITISGSSNPNILTVNVFGSRLAITGAITGSGSSWLIKQSNGTLILGNPVNAWTRLILENGTVRVGVAGALPANSALEMNSTDAILDLNNNDATIGVLIGSFPTPLSAGQIRLGSATLTITGTSSYDGQIVGTGNLVKTGPSTLTLSGPFSNTYTGTTTVNGGTLNLWMDTPGRTAIAGPIVVNAGTLWLVVGDQIADTSAVTINNPGVFVLANSSSETIGSLAGNGNVTLGAATLTVGANNSSREGPARRNVEQWVPARTRDLHARDVHRGSPWPDCRGRVQSARRRGHRRPQRVHTSGLARIRSAGRHAIHDRQATRCPVARRGWHLRRPAGRRGIRGQLPAIQNFLPRR